MYMYGGALHLYDMVQVDCGLPAHKRVVTALALLRPSNATFHALLASLRLFSSHHLRHYSEQTALACHFANDSFVLPCRALWDMSAPGASRSGLEKAISTSERQCKRFALQNMRKSWPDKPAAQIAEWAGAGACALMRENQHKCGTFNASEVLAVHFKGKHKPWLLASRKLAGTAKCGRLRHGQLEYEDVSHSSDIRSRQYALQQGPPIWDKVGGFCLSGGGEGRKLRWAMLPKGRRQEDQIIKNDLVPQGCCDMTTVIAAEWYSLIRGPAIKPTRPEVL
ncbi:MAG: hypothetical protein SGPRY_003204 [Prymnesium sp.]